MAEKENYSTINVWSLFCRFSDRFDGSKWQRLVFIIDILKFYFNIFVLKFRKNYTSKHSQWKYQPHCWPNFSRQSFGK